VWRELGRPPGGPMLKRLGRFVSAPYARHWGSVWRACQVLAAFHAGRLTRGELLRPQPHPSRRKRLPNVERWRILKRDDFRCVACGRRPSQDAAVELEVDHIHPVSKGVDNGESNLRTLCKSCNQSKRVTLDGPSTDSQPTPPSES